MPALRAVVGFGALAAGPAAAGPWLAPGDARLRTDVELLRAHGLVQGPVGSWPLPVAQLDAALERAEGRPLAPVVAAAVRRVRAILDWELRPDRYRVDAAATNQPALVRGFAETARGKAEGAVGVQHDRGRFTFALGGSATVFPDAPPYYARGNRLRPNRSFLAMQLGNWALWGGHVERYWGPSREGGLLLSTSARTYPQLGIRTLEPRRIDLPVLRWAGPVAFELAGGVLPEKRGDSDRPALVGMRIEAAPLPGLSVAVSRQFMFCGEGRPCGLGTVLRALFAVGENTGGQAEPGNQLAGWEVVYDFPLGARGFAGRLFIETAAEDEDDFRLQKYARRAGGHLAGPLGGRGASFRLGAEHVDTLASSLFTGLRFPGVMYNHFLYTDGLTFERRPVGFSLDGDARMTTVAGEVTDARNRLWYASVRDIALNVRETPTYRISRTREDLRIVQVGAELPTILGDLRFELRHLSDRPDTPGQREGQWQLEAGWRSRF
ncbi:MAG: capsule assembly Wzi family protein [Sphingomonadaceae bacterium]|uniref:capsule assembly Wzi family protein n=1 Tax=Thermaurantiacus sp. TaxID=2820283 RepID=UPI00298F07F3|nr:capsule assembly Wzi family protein [Thermaurantiacus sp.]MCS6986689.1 capsule assembly Wzi family protein [Sphingomonadaceae bacterium]MDW8414048.1 capsule assembly Wzi family protein [Thermaurantiacus sp.]